jgi:dTDP-4-dehydrorhamnose reductase
MSRKTILVTGATGLLGKGLEETALKGGRGARIIGVHLRPYKVDDPKARHIVLDIRDPAAVRRLFDRHRFDAVIHAAGIASVDYVERHYAESLESNLLGTLNITSAARKAGCHLVYVSTNAVFDGTSPPYRESDPVRPVNKYGRIKVECERLVSETLTDYTIVRPILMYGWNHMVSRPNPATWMYEKLMRGERIQVVTDVRENPLYNVQCGEALWRVLARRPGGVIHLGGGESVSRHEFALKLAETFGLDASLITPVANSYFKGIAPRPPDTTFAVERMTRELGIKALKVSEGLKLMKASMGVKA